MCIFVLDSPTYYLLSPDNHPELSMADLHISIVRTEASLEEVRELLRSYAILRKHDRALGDYEKELGALPGEYAPPCGCLLLARWRDKAAGVVAYREIAEGVCEMKRMYVLPGYQGRGIGKALGNRLIAQAREAGYVLMKLDTHPWMEPAQRLYHRLGFVETTRYNDNPTEGIRFFELELT